MLSSLSRALSQKVYFLLSSDFFKISILCLLFTGASSIFAQDKKLKQDKQVQDSISAIEKQIAEDQKKIRELLGSPDIKSIEGRFEELLKNFYKDYDKSNINKAFESFFDDKQLNKFLKQWKPHQGLKGKQFRWIETPTERILIIDIEQAKDTPLDINIGDKIIIKGKTAQKFEKKNSTGVVISSRNWNEDFKQIFYVPKDTDPNKVKIENHNGEIYIKLPKKNRKNVKGK